MNAEMSPCLRETATRRSACEGGRHGLAEKHPEFLCFGPALGPYSLLPPIRLLAGECGSEDEHRGRQSAALCNRIDSAQKR